MKPITRVVATAVAGVLLAAPALLGSVKVPSAPADLGQKVRHELVMLPYYSVFDNLEYKVEGNAVTLSGQVVWSALKSDAYQAVKSIPGVGTVTNNIQVLPLSGFDNQIRRAELRAIYSNPVLSRYAWGPVPPIHIIVSNGHVTLAGVVANQTDKNIAGLMANGVAGVFSVENNLRVEKS